MGLRPALGESPTRGRDSVLGPRRVNFVTQVVNQGRQAMNADRVQMVVAVERFGGLVLVSVPDGEGTAALNHLRAKQARAACGQPASIFT